MYAKMAQYYNRIYSFKDYAADLATACQSVGLTGRSASTGVYVNG